MLINLLLDIGIVLFVLFAAVPVLDVLLSDAQKERFSKEVHHVWYWLDKHSQKSYLLALQRAKVWIVLTGVGLASCFVIWAYFYGRRGETSAGVFEFFVLAALCLLIGWWCVSFANGSRLPSA
jgi:multisubunit Na+/H+ antiporter MnhB subunit